MMNLSSTRIVDPVLTTIAQGYFQQPYELDSLFPIVPVPLHAGKIVEFGKEAFRLPTSKRSFGSDIQAITIGYQGRSYTMEDHALAGMIPIEEAEEAESALGLDLQAQTIFAVTQQLRLKLEYDRATLATNAALYGASHKNTFGSSTKWSVAATCTPINDIDAGIVQIRQDTGRLANQLYVSDAIFRDLKNCTQIRNYLQYTTNEYVTEDILAKIFGLEKMIVVRAIYASGANDAFSDVWGNFALLANARKPGALNAAGSFREPSYGYTYTMKGGLFAEQPWYRNQSRTWYFPMIWQRLPVVTSLGGGTILPGYLFVTPH